MCKKWVNIGIAQVLELMIIIGIGFLKDMQIEMVVLLIMVLGDFLNSKEEDESFYGDEKTSLLGASHT